MINMKKGSVSVTFDRYIKTINESIFAIKMITYDPSVDFIAKGSLTAIKNIYVTKFHKTTGHCGVCPIIDSSRKFL
jgi:hypothetical protein